MFTIRVNELEAAVTAKSHSICMRDVCDAVRKPRAAFCEVVHSFDVLFMRLCVALHIDR